MALPFVPRHAGSRPVHRDRPRRTRTSRRLAAHLATAGLATPPLADRRRPAPRHPAGSGPGAGRREHPLAGWHGDGHDRPRPGDARPSPLRCEPATERHRGLAAGAVPREGCCLAGPATGATEGPRRPGAAARRLRRRPRSAALRRTGSRSPRLERSAGRPARPRSARHLHAAPSRTSVGIRASGRHLGHSRAVVDVAGCPTWMARCRQHPRRTLLGVGHWARRISRSSSPTGCLHATDRGCAATTHPAATTGGLRKNRTTASTSSTTPTARNCTQVATERGRRSASST